MDPVIDQISGVLERVVNGSAPSAAALLDQHAADLNLDDPERLEAFYADVWQLFCDQVGVELAALKGP